MIPVAIIGAGIVGVSTALWLQRAGRKVVLIDKSGVAAGASFGNGGVLASCSVVPVTTPGLLNKAARMVLDPNQPLFLKWRYLPRLVPWLAKYLAHANEADTRRISQAIHGVTGDSLAEHQALSAGTRAERFVVPADYLFLYRDRAHYLSDAFGWSLRAEAGFIWDEFDEAAMRAYDPAYGPSVGFAARLRNHGRISDPGAYVGALANHLVANGGKILKAEATDFVREHGHVVGVRVSTADGAETVACTSAVLATGAWSGALAAKLGLTVPIESERGYHLDLWEPSIMPRSPVMVASGKFVATPMEGRLRLAGIVEFGGLKAPPSRQPFRLLEANIRAAIPGLTWAHKTEWMGHRPAPADSIPVIGAVPGAIGAFMGFGHHHIGMTAGPRTGRLLAQIVTGQKPNTNLALYAPSRFQ